MKPVAHGRDYQVNIRITEKVVTMLVYCLRAVAQTHLVSQRGVCVGDRLQTNIASFFNRG
jgi:hypothetical protein